MKIIKYSLLVLLVASFFSCSDDDITLNSPNDAVIDTYFNNEDEFVSAILGTYDGFKGTGLYSGSGSSQDLVILADLLSDNLITSQDGRGSNRDGHNWLYNGGNVPTFIYSSAYGIVARANLILMNIDNLPDEDFPSKELIRSEALALRAIAHFEVARHYLKIPTQSIDANSFVGIAYVENYDPYAQPSRLGTVQETYAKIMNDLESSLDGLPNSVQVGRLSKPAIRAMIGRVALYMGNYEKAVDFLNPVVESINPAASSELASLWRSTTSPGVLFEIPMVANLDPQLGSNYSQGLNNNVIAIEYSVDRAFRDLYNDSTEPQRVQAYFRVFKNQYCVMKYAFGPQAGLANGRYLRVEEAILNLAEAQYLSGNQSAALVTLDKLRNARYTSFSGGESGDELFNAIQLERRKELAFEGDRFFTLKRLLGVSGIPNEYSEGIVRSGNGYLLDGSGAASAEQVLPADSYKWQLPISIGTLNLNPNMTQTPGY